MIGNIITSIEGLLPDTFWEALSLAMSYEIPGAAFSQVYQNGHWDGRKKLMDKRHKCFPTGLLSVFREIAPRHGIGYEIVDCRRKPSLGSRIPLKDVELRDYQLEILKVALQKQRGIIRSPTGSGKTVCIAGLIGETNLPTCIFIHKQDIFHQLVDRISNHLGVEVGKIGCGIVYPRDITICMIQTVHRAYGGNLKGVRDVEKDLTVIPKPEIIKQCVERAECVITDEAHHTSSAIYSAVLPKCTKAFYRWNFSATPFREDGADLLLDAHAGPKCIDLSASDLIKRGYLAKPTFYMLEFNHGRPSYTDYASCYEQQVVQNIFRNKLIVQAVLKTVANNKSCLIAVTRIEHGQILEAMLNEIIPGKVKFAHGGVDSQERKNILKDLEDKKILAVICTTVFGEGVDIKSLDVLISTKAAQSATDAYQLAGRALRRTPTKETATIIDIYDDHCKYLGKHSKKRLSIYKTEPEFAIRQVDSIDKIVF